MSKLIHEKFNKKSVSYDLEDDSGRVPYRIILKEPNKPFAPANANNMKYQLDDVTEGELCPYTELIIENTKTKQRSIKRCFQDDEEIKMDVVDDFDSGQKKYNWR